MKRAITHDLLRIPPNTLVKDYKPKYNIIELLEERKVFPFSKVIGMMKFETVKKFYGNRTIVSVMDFNDTKTTSIALKKEQHGKQKS